MSKAIIALDKSKSYRVYLTISTDMVQEAAGIHETTPLASAGLGRVLTAAGLMGIMLKNDEDKLTLNAILNQRSNDVLTANNWNVAQYALLVHMLAQVCDMYVGELVHVIADAHIYDRHIPLIEELITREEHPAPKVWLNPEKKDFYEFTVDDLHVEDYVTGPQIKHIPVAV